MYVAKTLFVFTFLAVASARLHHDDTWMEEAEDHLISPFDEVEAPVGAAEDSPRNRWLQRLNSWFGGGSGGDAKSPHGQHLDSVIDLEDEDSAQHPRLLSADNGTIASCSSSCSLGDDDGVLVCRKSFVFGGGSRNETLCINPDHAVSSDICGCCGGACPAKCECGCQMAEESNENVTGVSLRSVQYGDVWCILAGEEVSMISRGLFQCDTSCNS